MTGETRWPRRNHSSMARRSYVYPSSANTGSCMIFSMMGHSTLRSCCAFRAAFPLLLLLPPPLLVAGLLFWLEGALSPPSPLFFKSAARLHGERILGIVPERFGRRRRHRYQQVQAARSSPRLPPSSDAPAAAAAAPAPGPAAGTAGGAACEGVG